MPTTRPRHMITETDDLSEALRQAAKLWPELAGQPPLLIRRLLEVGIEQIDHELSEKAKKRLANIQKFAGSLDDVWPANWKEEQAQDWPN